MTRAKSHMPRSEQNMIGVKCHMTKTKQNVSWVKDHMTRAENSMGKAFLNTVDYKMAYIIEAYTNNQKTITFIQSPSHKSVCAHTHTHW